MTIAVYLGRKAPKKNKETLNNDIVCCRFKICYSGSLVNIVRKMITSSLDVN